MSQSVLNISYQIIIYICQVSFQHFFIFVIRSNFILQNINYQFYNINILLFIKSTNIVNFSQSSVSHNQVNSFTVILNIKPISYIVTFPINRQFLPFKYIFYHQRNQFFWKMVRTIIIRTSCNIYRHFISFSIRNYNMVGSCF